MDPKTGRRVIISFAMNRHDMENIGLGGPHCGDIVYFMENEFSRTHGNGLSNQTMYGFSTRCLLLMAGVGFKKGAVVKRNCKVVDVVLTICNIAGAPMPKDVEGSVIYEALENFED